MFKLHRNEYEGIFEVADHDSKLIIEQFKIADILKIISTFFVQIAQKLITGVFEVADCDSNVAYTRDFMNIYIVCTYYELEYFVY